MLEQYLLILKKVVERSRAVSEKLSSGVMFLLKKNKVTLINGVAYIKDKNTITVGKKVINTKNIIIATGAQARDLPNIKCDGKKILNYSDAMIQTKIPKSLLVIGSGAIGSEFANFYSSIGSKVTIVEMQDKILPMEDSEISEILRQSFQKQGMDIYTSTIVKSLDTSGSKICAMFDVNNRETKLSFDSVISAVGIVGNVESFGLENLQGIKVEHSHIVTNNVMETGEKGVFAIGDVAAAPWLAHKASHEAVLCIDHIAGLKVHGIDKTNIPSCTYTHPQVASVGLTEKKALDAGYKIKVGRFTPAGNGKSIALGEEVGLVKTIFDEVTGELLGAHMIGADVTELIQGYVIAKTAECTNYELRHTIFPHPTLSEMMHESILDAYDDAIHS